MIPGAHAHPGDRCRSGGANVRADQLDIGTLANQGRVDRHTLSGRDRGVDLDPALTVLGLGLLPAVEGLRLQACLGAGFDLGRHVASDDLAACGRHVLPNPEVRLGSRRHSSPLELATAVGGPALARARPARIAGRTGVGGSLSRADREG